jgi:hypothetical protein
VLEGTIDLAGEFGALPESVRVAVALFGNADGGALLATHQIPASVNANGNVDAGEYLVIDLCTLGGGSCCGGSCCPADFDQDGGVTGADVEAFFAAFEGGDPAADMDEDGGVTGADVEAFFVAFEGGC